MIPSILFGLSLLQTTALKGTDQAATGDVWQSRTSLRPGDALPHFKLTPAPGTTVQPMSDAGLQGHRTVFVIVAALCPHCQREAALLANLKTHFSGKLQFVFASVSDAKDTKRFVHDIGLRDCTYLGGLPIALGADVHHLPLLLLVDRAGKVIYVQHHEVERGLEQAILDAFSEGRVIPSEGLAAPVSQGACSINPSITTCDVGR